MGVWLNTYMHYELAHVARVWMGLAGAAGGQGRYHPCVSGIGNYWLLYVVQNKLMYCKALQYQLGNNLYNMQPLWRVKESASWLCFTP